MATKRYPEKIEYLPRSLQIFIRILDNRINAGKNVLAIVVGQTGSGKSLSTVMIMIGLYLYQHGKMPTPEYITEHCIFKARDLLKKFNDRNLKPGVAWNWDEAGVDISHKTHASLQNRVIGWLAQTFRHQRQIVFFTVPTVSFIDASVRKLLHFQLETKFIDKSKKLCKIKPLHYQYNLRLDKIYYHNIKYPRKDGLIDIIDLMNVPLPPKEFVVAYETKKECFTKDLNIYLQQMLENQDDKNKPRLTERQKKILELLQQGVLSTTKIAEKLEMYVQDVSTNFRYMRNKGINVDYFLKNRPFSGFRRKAVSNAT